MNGKLLAKAASIVLANPQWRRKLKTIAIVGLVGFIISGGLVIWAGWAAAKYVVQEMGPVVETGVKAVESAETAITQGKVPTVGFLASVEKCWIKVQSLQETENLIVGGATGGLYTALISVKDACLSTLQPEKPKNSEQTGEVI